MLMLATSLLAAGETPVREKLLLDVGWRFHFGDASNATGDFGYGSGEAFAKAGDAIGAARPEFNDSSWRRLDLPHDWAVELEFVYVKNEDLRDHGYKPLGRDFPKTSIGWYRKAFMIPKADLGKRLSVEFDGVFRDCVVWFNGHYLGGICRDTAHSRSTSPIMRATERRTFWSSEWMQRNMKDGFTKAPGSTVTYGS